MNNPIDTVSAPAHKASDTAREAWNTTRKTASEAIQTGERYVREQPIPSALQILGIGLVLGGLLGWVLGHSHEEDTASIARRLAKELQRKFSLD